MERQAASRFDDIFKFAKTAKSWPEIIAQGADSFAHIASIMSHYREADELPDPKILGDLKGLAEIIGQYRIQLNNQQEGDRYVKQSMNNLADYLMEFNERMNAEVEAMQERRDNQLFELNNLQQEKIAAFDNKTQEAHQEIIGYLEGVNKRLGINAAGGEPNKTMLNEL